jgi:hypothetical protein
MTMQMGKKGKEAIGQRVKRILPCPYDSTAYLYPSLQIAHER